MTPSKEIVVRQAALREASGIKMPSDELHLYKPLIYTIYVREYVVGVVHLAASSAGPLFALLRAPLLVLRTAAGRILAHRIYSAWLS